MKSSTLKGGPAGNLQDHGRVNAESPAAERTTRIREGEADGWLIALEEIGVECFAVIGPNPFGQMDERIVAVIYPELHLNNARLLAASDGYGAAWRATNSPLVAWQNLSRQDRSKNANWGLPWLETGMLSVVRVEIPLPLTRGFECFLFGKDRLGDSSHAEVLAWRTMSAWPIIKATLLAQQFEISPRELQVIKFTAEGATASEAGEAMGVSARTAQFHLNNAMMKLRSHNRVAAIMRACWCGII